MQRRIMDTLIYPHYVGDKCHPKVESLVALLRDLTATMSPASSPTTGGISDSEGSEVRRERPRPFSTEEWDRMAHPAPGECPSGPVAMNRAMALQRQCMKYRTEADEWRRKADEERIIVKRLKQETLQGEGGDDDVKDRRAKSRDEIVGAAERFREANLLGKAHELNFRHCISKSACPSRTSALSSCWKFLGPDNIGRAAERGMVEWVCRNEREAVERCTGSMAMELTRLAMND